MRISRIAAVAVFAAASPALAASVYLNGVQVDGMANQKFTNATVSFDEKGNVHVDAPGVEVKAMQPGGAAPQVVTKHYFLVPQQAVLAMAGYDIDVFVNGKWVQRLREADEPNPIDVTKFVTGGGNKILFTAHKKKENRKSFSPAHSFSVMLGEGTAGGDQVVIDNTLLTFKRTAAEGEDVTEEFSFTAR